ncbi:Hpt domain-containing protein [Achromobacter marplatensis]|uniref:Hpt domain-containing protein n=1 Tax=Achromobacter marplatensis TaxID=470868 RepID=UPI0039F6A9FC
MNLALVIGRRPERLRELAERLEGLGLAVDTCADAAALSGYPAAPRVVLWDEDTSLEARTAVPGPVAAAPIRLKVSASGASCGDINAATLPSATEAALLQALLQAGYGLPEDSECAAIRQTLHDLVDGDSTIVAELIGSLLDTGQADLADYRARCAQANWVAAGSLAHRIKGTARMAGCASLVRISERIEAASRNESGEAVMRLNALFEPALQRLCTELSRLRQPC